MTRRPRMYALPRDVTQSGIGKFASRVPGIRLIGDLRS